MTCWQMLLLAKYNYDVFCCYPSDISKSLVFQFWYKGKTWLWNVGIPQNQEALYSRKEHITSLCGKILVIMLWFHPLLCLGRLFSKYATIFSNTVHNRSLSLSEIPVPKAMGFWSDKLYFFLRFLDVRDVLIFSAYPVIHLYMRVFKVKYNISIYVIKEEKENTNHH